MEKVISSNHGESQEWGMNVLLKPAMAITLLDRALYLLEAGFHVFPLGGHGETPPDYFVKERHEGNMDKAREAWPKAPRVSWRAFQTTPPTEETVRHWWGVMWPYANIGIATGKLIVVDADSAVTADWVKGKPRSTRFPNRSGRRVVPLRLRPVHDSG